MFTKIAVLKEFKAGDRTHKAGKVLVVGKDAKADIHPRDAVKAIESQHAEPWNDELPPVEAPAEG